MKINVNMLHNIKCYKNTEKQKKTGDNNFYVIMLNMNKEADYSKALTCTNVTDKKL
jgi:hypothetical protein